MLSFPVKFLQSEIVVEVVVEVVVELVMENEVKLVLGIFVVRLNFV